MNELSGYGEVTLNGKTIPLKFGTLAYKLFTSSRGIELHQLGEAFNDPFAMIELGYYAHVANERINGRVADVTLEWFTEAVGDTKGVIEEFTKLITSSKMWGYTVTELAEQKKTS